MELSPELLQAIAALELRSRRRVTGLLAGDYHTAFRGSGMQFKEFRHYEAGDDIRHMSWSVTAKTGKPTIKVFEEERELNVVLVVDTSGSSLFQHQAKRKMEMYAELVALLGMAAIRSGDKVGSLLFNDAPLQYTPPDRNRNRVLVSMAQLLAQDCHGKGSQLLPALEFLEKTLKTRSIIIVISDFIVPDFTDSFRRLAKRNELILLHCYDDAERGLGIKGVHEVFDPETKNFHLLDFSNPKTQQAFASHHLQLSHRLEQLAKENLADYLPLSIEDDYLHRLIAFFRSRGPARI